MHGWQTTHPLSLQNKHFAILPLQLVDHFSLSSKFTSFILSATFNLRAISSSPTSGMLALQSSFQKDAWKLQHKSQNPELSIYEADHVHNIVFEICHFSSVILEVPTPI